MIPTRALQTSGGNQDDAISPARNWFHGVVHAVRVAHPVTFGDRIPFSAGSQIVEHTPKLCFVEREFQQPGRERTLAETVAIAEEHRLSCYAQHFLYDSRGVRRVMQGRKLTHRIETGVGKRQRLARGLNDKARDISVLRSLPHQSRYRLNTAHECSW